MNEPSKKTTLIDKIRYDREHFGEMFEQYVGNLATRKSLMTYFQYSGPEMDNECMKAFGMNFEKAYAYFFNEAINECEAATTALAKQGNGAALKIAAECIWNLRQEEERKGSTVTVVVGKLDD